MFTEDVAAAQALMAEAGYEGGAGFPVVNIVCQNSDQQKLMAQILGEMWKTNLGVQYTITTYESSTYWDELANGNFSVGRNGYTCDYLDPSANLKIWVSGSNCSENGWDDTVYDDMVAAASLILDPAAREQALIEAEAYLCAQMPGMPMYTMTDDYLVKSDLKGIVKNKIGHIYFEYAHFE
jgi:oligopeptide transport system substrate-binding protein